MKKLLSHSIFKANYRSIHLLKLTYTVAPSAPSSGYLLQTRPLLPASPSIKPYPRQIFTMANITTNPSTSPIIRFYDPNLQAPDSEGRTLSSILAWDNHELERCHDYIQWLFPLPERSSVSFSAPVIDRSTFHAFRTRSELRDRMRDALERICRFYGFYFLASNDPKCFRIERFIDLIFETRAHNWVKRFTHNHLRITRIIRSLRVLGLEAEAREFFRAVRNVYDITGKIGAGSLMHWTRAMERPLYLAPEDDEDGGNGKDFLYEFEAEKDRKTKDLKKATVSDLVQEPGRAEEQELSPGTSNGAPTT